MKPGLVYGDFHVLTSVQIEQIESWAKENGITDVYFSVKPEDIPYMEYWMNQNPTFLLYKDSQKTPENTLELSEDPDLREGNFEALPVRLRGILIERGLYREECAHRLLKPKRYAHVESMTDLAVTLAKIHGADLNKTRIAGLFHDCTKALPDEKNLTLMRLCAPEYLSRSKEVYHQYTGPFYLKFVLGYTDEEVLEAIRHHTDGDDEGLLSKILYLADKLDPSRGYDVTDMIDLAKKDLDAAVKKERELQLEYLRKKGIIA